MKKISVILSLLFLTLQWSVAQCYCEDCPAPILNGSPSSVTLNVSGITNNILGQNGQSVLNVGVSFTHGDAQEMSLRLVAPDGSFVDLMIGEGIGFGNLNNFEIDFLPCSGSPNPDCANNATWTSTDDWDSGPYTGSYYPESGCFEDLTGDVNGTWTIEIDDVFSLEDGELFCFDITFADDAGAICNSSGCADQVCFAQGGQLMNPLTVLAPEGDPSLEIDFDVEYAVCEVPAPSPEYTYVWVVYEPFPGPIIDIFEGTVDLTTYGEGTYIVSGLSILASDLPTVQALDFATTTFADVFDLLVEGDICADNVTIHSVVEINNCAINFNGFINFEIIDAEEGDPALDPDWPITWTPEAPDFSVWGIYYVVYDQTTGVIIDYLLTDDFTGLEEGNYQVSIMVYLLSDQSNIPPIDGVLTYSDLGAAIVNEELCAVLFGFNLLNISGACTAAEDASGILEQDNISAPVGDPALDPDWDVTFTNGDPDPAVYGFYFVVFDPVTDEIIALLPDDDFTSLPSGNYNVALLYYDLEDETICPTADGTNEFIDIVFLINNGDLCATYFGLNLLNITLACEADAGTFSTTSFSECEGSGDLVLNLTPDYTGSAPDDNVYGYTYVVSENGVIIEIDPSNDFTDYTVGVYEICGMSYLLADQPLLPDPNGSLTVSDIQNDIDNGVYCADLTVECIELEITEEPEVIFTGPTEVCAGVEVQYVVENFTGDNNDYLFTINQGSFTQFINDENGTLSIIWASGPGNICATEIDGWPPRRLWRCRPVWR